MVVSDDLFELIRSLSRAEKSYFKKFSTIHVVGERNNYVRLFDAIEEMKEYNESKLLKKFEGEKFVNQFSVAKNYLYNSILKSLKSYRKPKTKKEEVKDLLLSVSVLYDRGLFGQCRKILRKCRKLAGLYENYGEVIEILVWELKILIQEKAYDTRSKNVVNRNYEERKKVLGVIENMYGYDRLEYNITLYALYEKEQDKKKYIGELKRLMSDPLMTGEEKALSTVAKLKYFTIKALYFYVTEDTENSLKYLKKEIKLLEDTPPMLEEKKTDYFILYGNMLSMTLTLNKLKSFENEVFDFRAKMSSPLARGSGQIIFYILRSSYLLLMQYYLKTGDYKKIIDTGMKMLKELEENHFELNIVDTFTVDHRISYAYFLLQDFDGALEWSNRILNNREAEEKYRNYYLARIYNLIIHFELGNIDLLEYQVRSTYAYFLKRKSVTPFEKVVFAFLRKLPGAIDNEELKELFKELRYNLKKIEKDASFKEVKGYFDFISWLESKAEKRSMAEVLKDIPYS